jgi:hypothetical protein
MKTMHGHHPNVKQHLLERTIKPPPITFNEEQRRYEAALGLRDLSQSSRLHQGLAGSSIWIPPRDSEDQCSVTSSLVPLENSDALSGRSAVHTGAISRRKMSSSGLAKAPFLSLAHACRPSQKVPCSSNITVIRHLPLAHPSSCSSVAMVFVPTYLHAQYSSGTQGHHKKQHF